MSGRCPGGARPTILILVLLTASLCAALVLCTTLGLLAWRRVGGAPGTGLLGPAATAPAARAESAPTASPIDTATLLARTHVPPLDPYDLARRLNGGSGPTRVSRRPVAAATPASPRQYSLGDQESFWVLNLDTVETHQVTATLRLVTPHLYMWVEDDVDVQQEALERSAQIFGQKTYPAIRQYFGSEWNPGIDNDPRLTILNARFSGAIGYFAGGDEYLTEVMPYSNQREMFYINPERAEPGTLPYDTTLAHEFQHMVHWYADSNEDTWVTEGASELAAHLCGYPRNARIHLFAGIPDTQLTNWESYAATQHYGASFLFLTYFAERFGPEMTRQLVANEGNGIAGFKAVLQANATGLSFRDLFADWVIANYVDAAGYATHSPYAYEGLDVQVMVERTVSSYPAEEDGTVHQYAADYVELQPPEQDVRLDFSGPATAKLVPNQPHSGKYQWWSNRGDSSNMTLTRAFDLSRVEQASLEAWLWYDIEEGWDYAYVEASTDGGLTWQILPGQYTTAFNPSGNSYGLGYTGVSAMDHSAAGEGNDRPGGAEWIRERFDLSPFVGQEVHIRFEYLTDEAVHHPGLCVDDISIPELGYCHDAEEDDGGWVAEGFIRSDNTVPQGFIVQLIRLPQNMEDGVSVEQLSLQQAPAPPQQGEWQSGSWVISGLDEEMREAILVIAAVAPSTTEVASYHYELHPTQ